MKNVFLRIAIFALATAAFPDVNAQTYIADKSIALPGNGGYDYLTIDKTNNKLYVSHGTEVNIIDLKTEKPVGVISNLKGIHGIAIVNKLNRGFITDGKANALVVFDLATRMIVNRIPLKGAKGPDAILYDPFTERIFTFNGDSNNASVIDLKTLKQIGTVSLGGAPEFGVADGKGKIYNNLEDKSSLNVIDSKTLKVTENYTLAPCSGPTGLALDLKNQRAFSVCRVNRGMSVVDINSGKVIVTIPIGAGADAVAYDPVTKLIFCSCGDGVTTIVKQETANDYKIVQILKTQERAKTLALDLETHKLYLSVANFEKGTRKELPGTFKVLVYKLQ